MQNFHSLQMRSHLAQQLSQRMMTSPKMQQALQFLQLPVMELSQLVDQELESNPLLDLLEEDGEDSLHFRSAYHKKGVFMENLVPYAPTLRESLHEQIDEVFEDSENEQGSNYRTLGKYIIDNFDESGFLNLPLEEIAILTKCSLKDVKIVLKKIQQMDPPGVGASSIQESLLLQLERKGLQDSLSYVIVKDYYDDLLHNRLSKIQKKLGCELTDLKSIIKHEISSLELHPGLNFQNHQVQEIIPDIILRREESEIFVEVIDEYSFRLTLNHHYLKIFEDPSVPVETKDFIKEKIQSAKWLMKNIGQRNLTLKRIAEELIRLNRSYFLDPNGLLVPLTMRELAETLELHESTIARAVANKFLYCDRGMVALKNFFSTKYQTKKGELISSKTIQDKIRKLIGEEDPSKPYSDEKISILLKQQGIECARRTVAKYRDAMKIYSAPQRRS